MRMEMTSGVAASHGSFRAIPAEFGATECQACKKIAREICSALVELIRAGQDELAWKQANRRRVQVLRDKQYHELRTGHCLPA